MDDGFKTTLKHAHCQIVNFKYIRCKRGNIVIFIGVNVYSLGIVEDIRACTNFCNILSKYTNMSPIV